MRQAIAELPASQIREVANAGLGRSDVLAFWFGESDEHTPNNPTGWTLTRTEQQAILAHCRRTGTWIIADEVYERIYFAPRGADTPRTDRGAGHLHAAPSFLDIAAPDDRVVIAHSFSKS